jgi:hypothetical protein
MVYKIYVMKKLYLFFTLASILLVACSKEEITPDPTVTTMDELQVEASFDWNTGQSIDLIIKGLPTTIPVKSTLSVSLPNGDLVYQGSQLMSDNTTLKLIIPVVHKQLLIKFGTNTYTVAISDGVANFSFIPEIVD